MAIHPKCQEPSFWEAMDDSFVLLAYTSLAASRTFLQWLLTCLNFPIIVCDVGGKMNLSGYYDGKCLQKCIIYKVDVITNKDSHI